MSLRKANIISVFNFDSGPLIRLSEVRVSGRYHSVSLCVKTFKVLLL